MDVRGRRLSFDYGSVRIGVAICDPDGILATPLPFLSTSHPKLNNQIIALIEEYQPIKIYLGYPRHLSGESGESVALVEEFKEKLIALTDVPIIFVDERMSTVSAAKLLREAGKSAIDSKALIDSFSAVAILEHGLSIEKR
jgi:putative Holliday junction resolvase